MPEEEDKAEAAYNAYNASTDDGDASSSSGSSEGLLSPTDKKEYRPAYRYDGINGIYDDEEDIDTKPRTDDDLWWAVYITRTL